MMRCFDLFILLLLLWSNCDCIHYEGLHYRLCWEIPTQIRLLTDVLVPNYLNFGGPFKT